MEILIFETRDKSRIEIQHAEVMDTNNASEISAGDHLLRIQHPGGFTQIVLSPEQWGRLVDSLSGFRQRAH